MMCDVPDGTLEGMKGAEGGSASGRSVQPLLDRQQSDAHPAGPPSSSHQQPLCSVLTWTFRGELNAPASSGGWMLPYPM